MSELITDAGQREAERGLDQEDQDVNQDSEERSSCSSSDYPGWRYTSDAYWKESRG